MNSEAHFHTADLAELTVKIVAAFVGNNPVPVANLPGLIASVHASLSRLVADTPATGRQSPAVDPKRSVTPNTITCLEDGKKFKSMARHLSSAHGMTPQQYREKWGLPPTYPMVSKKHSERRSAAAKASGSGTGSQPQPEIKSEAP
jgi:predicted transcriptional regulator